MSIELLRCLPLFAGLSEDHLNRLYQMAEPVALRAGELLIQEGTPGDSMYIVLDGEFEVAKRSGQRDITIAVRAPGEVIGEMSLLDHSPRSASVRAVRDSRLLRIPGSAFEQLLSSSPSAALEILRTVSARLRQNQSLLRQSEKMAALGTLAAGLAHELNNPAAAVRRTSAQLREMLADWQRLNQEMDQLHLDSRQVETINRLRQEIDRRAASPPYLDPLTRSDRESELQTWLEDRGVDRAWDLAPTLVSLAWDVQALAALAEVFSAGQLGAVAQWLGAGCSVYVLLDEVGKGAERISEIVTAVKTYSYLDRAPVQEVDVHEGLENTLIILRHKLKAGVRVIREYAADLPRIEAYASELNQVWTNIMDNAIDAMGGQGELVVRTYAHNGHVVVELCDTGPGIPPDIQPRIFEPFFTTKPPGVGTGLGLNIAYNIVVEKHLGQIRVDSRPGATCFQVTLPVQLKRG
jgi:signal transduction histidine kinase